MKELTTRSKHVLRIYDSIDEMPVTRYHRFNQMMVMASGLGCDAQSINEKIMQVTKAMDDGDVQKAKVELLNLRQTFIMTANAVDPTSIAFASLVHSIDGDLCEDLSQSGLETTAKRIDDFLSVGERGTFTEGVKKKIEGELRYYFPESFIEDVERLVLLKRMGMELLEEIESGESRKEKIDDTTRRINRLTEAMDYAAFERDSEIAFQQSCHAITESIHKDAKRMSVIEFESAKKMLSERAKELERKTKTK